MTAEAIPLPNGIQYQSDHNRNKKLFKCQPKKRQKKMEREEKEIDSERERGEALGYT